MIKGIGACLLIVVSVLAFACSGPRINPSIGDEALFKEGLAFFEKKSYKKAIAYFKELTSNYPESELKTEARLLLADAYFANRQFDEAAEAYLNFRGAHPTHVKIPYAVYRTGLSYFQQLGKIDRDQSIAQKALTEFEGLVAEFPSSEYASDAREKRGQAKSFLAKREFYVGEFYYRQGKYNAALGRFFTILEKYSDTELAPSALLLAAKSYIDMGETELAKEALTALANGYPRSEYASEVKSLLSKINSASAKSKNEKKGFLASLNPLNLFRSNAKEKEMDSEEIKNKEQTLAKRKAILASYNSRASAGIEPAQRIGSTPSKVSASKVSLGTQSLKVEPQQADGRQQASLITEQKSEPGHTVSTGGKRCIDCHQQAHADGQPLAEGQKSDSWFRRVFHWLGL